MTDCLICHEPIVGRRTNATICRNPACKKKRHAKHALERYYRARGPLASVERPCPRCGKTFTREHPAQKFCKSPVSNCRYESNKKTNQKAARMLVLRRAYVRAGLYTQGGM
jgi:hypothetical protein